MNFGPYIYYAGKTIGKAIEDSLNERGRQIQASINQQEVEIKSFEVELLKTFDDAMNCMHVDDGFIQL